MATAIAVNAVGIVPVSLTSMGYLPMKEPLLIPGAALAIPWRPFEFKAFFIRANGRDGYVPGVALRTSEADHFGVFCSQCPHQMCLCNLTRDHRMVCPCHQSAFDLAADGEWLSGPAKRGLYKFDYEVRGEGLWVNGVENSIGDRFP